MILTQTFSFQNASSRLRATELLPEQISATIASSVPRHNVTLQNLNLLVYASLTW